MDARGVAAAPGGVCSGCLFIVVGRGNSCVSFAWHRHDIVFTCVLVYCWTQLVTCNLVRVPDALWPLVVDADCVFEMDKATIGVTPIAVDATGRCFAMGGNALDV